jgi:hypothetical protein
MAVIIIDSHDNGEDFTPPNISKINDWVGGPQIKCDGNNVYVIWQNSTTQRIGIINISLQGVMMIADIQ